VSIHPDDYDIDGVRAEWTGKCVSESVGRYPVECDPIRRHCHMTGDTNPLYLDPEFARNEGPYGDVIVSPSMLPLYFASNGPWPRRPRAPERASGGEPASTPRPAFTLGVPTPGDRGINMGTEWEFLRPIRVGERLRAKRTVTDVFVKGIKLDRRPARTCAVRVGRSEGLGVQAVVPDAGHELPWRYGHGKGHRCGQDGG
jgi:acyl dehydratase